MSEATVSSRLIWPFLTLARRDGFELDVPWDRFGLSAEEIYNPDTRIPHATINGLLTFALEVATERDIGLRAAELVGPGDFDLFELATRSRPTLAEAIEGFGALAPLLHDGADLTLSRHADGGEGRFSLRDGLTLDPVGHEFVLSLMLISIRRATGVDELIPLAAHFPHAKPARVTNHERIFGCPLHFDAPQASLWFSDDHLALPLVHASDAVNAALERAAEAVMAGLPARAGLLVDVTSTIHRLLPAGDCDVKTVARVLGMGSRTLQRRLQEQGTSFRGVLDEQRHRLAVRYLQDSALSLNEISYLLAFANTQAFHRAFKRWTGTTAAATRKG